jgi:TDG/mug DNA glycosylase family protein
MISYFFFRKEIKEGALILTEKLQKYKPKIAVFNGKGKQK